jgi:hypothetical protein
MNNRYTIKKALKLIIVLLNLLIIFTESFGQSTVDLSTRVIGTAPSGSSLEFHTALPATAANLVASPTAVGAGVYYAVYRDLVNNCYTTGSPIVVATNSCPSTTADLTIHQPIGSLPSNSTLEWHTALPATAANLVATPNAVGAGNYYLVYFDNSVNCYSLTDGVVVVAINSCGTQSADLSILKTGPSTVLPNGSVTYTLVVSNAGPSAANNATVSDPSVSNFTASSVSCGTVTGGATCPSSPTVAALQAGTLTIPTLPNGGSVTLTVIGTAGASGTITNVATVTPPTGVTDPTSSNNTNTATTTINLTADLSILKTGPSTVLPNGSVTYTLVVSNAGPSAANNATVSDPSVANFTASSVSCGTATGGATCPSSPTLAALQAGTLTIPTLPSGGSVTLTVIGTAGASGTITNVATVTPPTGVTDPTSSDNTNTATTTINCPTVNPPTAGSASPSSICAGGSSTLSATCATGTLTWYTDEALTITLASTTISPTATTTYYASCVSGTCKSTGVPVIVTVNSSPALTNANVTTTNPSTCSGADGSVKICGLISGRSYTFNYTKGGTSQTPATKTADASGCVSITALSAGNYANFIVTDDLTTCTSNTLSGPFVLSSPTPATITLGTTQNPSNCGSNDGFITINGLTSGTQYTLNYMQNSVAQTPVTFTASGTSYNLLGLTSGSYTGITVTNNGCTSNNLSSSLSDPTTAAISLGSKVNPTFCSGNDGRITVSGLAPSTNYTLNYSKDGIAQTPIVFTSSGTSYILLGLVAGNYTNIRVTNAGCVSNSISTTLTDPSAAIIAVASTTNTSACSASDGSITFSGLAPGTTYTIQFTKNGIPQTPFIYLAKGTSYTLSNLSAAAYSNIRIIDANCVSNRLSATILDPGAPTIATATVTQPTLCGSNDGSIILNGLTSGLNYVLSYVKDGVQQTTSSFTASGTSYTISALTAGFYTGITVKQGSCTSNSVNANLSNPSAAILAEGATLSPSNCLGANDGSIVITGLSQGVSYTLNYTKNGVAQTPINITNSPTTSFVINGLSSGNYTNINITQGGCTSNNINTTLLNPTPPTAPTNAIADPNPICAGTFTLLDATCATGTLGWFSDAGLTTLLTSSSVNPASTTTYYAACTLNGCVSVATPVTVTVIGTTAPVPTTLTKSNVCPSTTTDLTTIQPALVSGLTYEWHTVSSNPSAANLVSTATAVGAGTYYLYTKSTIGGCFSIASQPVIVTIVACPIYNPDVNITQVNVPVSGNVKTNDKDVVPNSTYGTPVAEPGNPSTCVPTGFPNTNGAYNFTCATPGVYTFNVPVCTPANVCKKVPLVITVLDNTNPSVIPPIANVDIATTPINTAVTLSTLSNDKPGDPNTSLNPSSVTVIVAPLRGTASVNATTGDITYTPASGYVGTDTLTYRVCDTGTPVKCATAKQIITINPAGSPNTTSAADDFNTTPINTSVSGNVKTNDSDPEGQTQTITAQTSSLASGKGTLVLASDGTYTFTPVTGFTGPVEFPYTICDNGTPQACAMATLYINVFPKLPDLTPTNQLDNLEFLTAGVSRDLIVNVFEIVGANQIAGSILQFKITKLSAFDITYSTSNGTSNVLGGTPNENSNWTFTEDSGFITVTAKSGVTMAASSRRRVGFTITRKAGVPSQTDQNITTTITFGSAGEIKTDNNKVITKITAN